MSTDLSPMYIEKLTCDVLKETETLRHQDSGVTDRVLLSQYLSLPYNTNFLTRYITFSYYRDGNFSPQSEPLYLICGTVGEPLSPSIDWLCNPITPMEV